MTDFHIGISYLAGTPDDAVSEFVTTVERPGLELRVQHQEPTPRASMEWLAATAVVVYLAKPYVDGFLSEMGEDHYNALKRGLVALGKRLLSRSAPQVTLISAGGRQSTGERFSIAYSVVAQAGERRSIKLLLPKAVSSQELSDAVEAFTSLLLDDGRLKSSIQEFDRLTPALNPVLVWFNPETQLIEVVDPRPNRLKGRA